MQKQQAVQGYAVPLAARSVHHSPHPMCACCCLRRSLSLPLPSLPPAADEQLLAARDGFLGEIQQVPPMYSAIKVRGLQAARRHWS